MSRKMKNYLSLLALISLFTITSGCSVFVSTPRTASIKIQGLDNKYHEYIVALDDACEEMDIRISKRYAIHVDFDWLWESNDRSQPYYDYETTADDDIIPPLTPWMLCKYRF